ncbi:hypothetical protein [Levilactobacillus koreensis]|nr:hypothetical protein [Levilactobacillus koreensis]
MKKITEIAGCQVTAEKAFAAKMMQVADEARQGKKYSWDEVKRELKNNG